MIRAGLVLTLALFCWVAPVLAGPVEWIEVPATEAGQQWWDRGSVRIDRDGYRTVLSRFTPAASEDGDQPSGELYVMQLDCSPAAVSRQTGERIAAFSCPMAAGRR